MTLLRSECNEWKHKYECLFRDHEKTLVDLKDTQEALSRCTENDKEDEEQIKFLKSEVQRITVKYNEEHELAELYEKKVDGLQLQVKTLQDEVDDLNCVKDAKERHIKDLTVQVDTLQNEVLCLRKANRGLKLEVAQKSAETTKWQKLYNEAKKDDLSDDEKIMLLKKRAEDQEEALH